MSLLIVLLGCVFVLSGAIVAHAIITAPTVTEPATVEQTTRAGALTFDEHAAVTALLRPDDPTLPDEDAAQIADATARAVDAYASYLLAKRDGASGRVLHQLVEVIYADLRESLTPPQLARALVIGLHPHADERARVLVNQFRSLPTRVES